MSFLDRFRARSRRATAGSTQFLDELRDRLRRIPSGPPPDPWRFVATVPVGGVIDVGFADESDLLLIVSYQGRGVYDCRAGVLVARDRAEPDDRWHDAVRLRALGIGPLAGQWVRIAGLSGGGLTARTADGWGVTRIAPDWPCERVVIEPPGRSVLDPNRAGGCLQIADDAGLRALGFSGTGRSLIVATSGAVMVWNRPGST